MEDSSEHLPKKKGNILDLYSMEHSFNEEQFHTKTAGYKLKESILDGLNEQQTKAVIGIREHIMRTAEEGKGRFFMLHGLGGSGKSYSIIRAHSGIPKDDIIAAAPSHFAKNVLINFLGEGYEVVTIAALLGKKVTYDDDGNEILTRIDNGKPPPIIKYHIVLLDEGSMIDDETATEIIDYVEKGNKTLIILGDYCQLPPVNQETDSLFFDDISAELTIPVRATGPVFDLATVIRKEIIKIRNNEIPSINIINLTLNRVSKLDEKGSGYIFLQGFETLIKAAIRRFKKDRGTQYVRVLAYRNKTIDRINMRIRTGLYGDNPKQFEEGEIVINNGGYSVKIPGKKDTQVVIRNGTVLQVKSTEDCIGPYDIPCKKLIFKDSGSPDTDIKEAVYVVATEGESLYKDNLNRLSAMAKTRELSWSVFWEFKNSFAYFNYNYATSIHKAQGSSIQHVFVMEDDVLSVRLTSTKEKLQSMYTAISRASYRVYVYNGAFKTDNSNILQEQLILDVPEETCEEH